MTALLTAAWLLAAPHCPYLGVFYADLTICTPYAVDEHPSVGDWAIPPYQNPTQEVRP